MKAQVLKHIDVCGFGFYILFLSVCLFVALDGNSIRLIVALLWVTSNIIMSTLCVVAISFLAYPLS